METKRSTLASIDAEMSSIQVGEQEVKQSVSTKSTEEVKAAYYQYLENADAEDASRQMAISRLAQMELELSDKLIADSAENSLEEDRLYTATLYRTIDLLTTSLADFPEAKGNDALLYQLARTYDQVGEYDLAIDSLKKLANKYSDSTYYAEAQFRIGEAAFANRDYLSAEDAYTETIISPNSERFYEKAFFKRGWTRYKQELYIESVDDYIESLALHRFGDENELTKNEKALFDEHFRAIGLAFSYLNGAQALRDYFSSNSNFRYLFHTYSTIADIYLKQERYADAVETLNQFVEHHPNKPEVPKAKLNIINIWQQSGFTSRVHASIEDFYINYHPSSSYWASAENTKYKAESAQALKQYIADEASYFHSLYQDKKEQKNKNKHFQAASLWYQRYLTDFADFGRKEGIYRQYGELLYSAKSYEKALPYLEKAAYDETIILDKQAAYLTVDITDTLYKKAKSSGKDAQYWLNKIINYSLRYVELYPSDSKSQQLGVHAAQLAFNNKSYQQALEIAQAIPHSDQNINSQYKSQLIQARSYFELGEFIDAENIYTTLLTLAQTKKQKQQIQDNLALTIYRQAEAANAANNSAKAMHHFTRIHKVVPESDIAASALYDGIALAMNEESWQQAIALGNQFKSVYPKHKFKNDVTKKLSVAYLNSDQGDKAAQEFEQISSFEKDEKVKMTALWQAAVLYEKKGDAAGAIRTYRDFAHQYKQAYAQNMEAMFKLSELYQKSNEPQKRHFWLRKIAAAGRKATESQKTERTIFIAASSTLELANQQKRAYQRVKLVAPLEKNLRKKKSLMQEAIKFYGNASSYGLADVTTESTFSIGQIYQDFSVALLESERPNNLSDDELEQYEILLEDQAFPFEDKAIEFYETNIARSKTGLYNEWLAQSRARLAELFPVRYARKPKLQGYLKP